MLNKSVFAPASILLVGFCWLWLAMEIVELGARWQSVSSIRHNVTVKLQNDQELTGTLTRGWDGSYKLMGRDGGIFVFRNFKVMTVPANGQITGDYPYKMVLPFAIYCLLSLTGCYILNKKRKSVR